MLKSVRQTVTLVVAQTVMLGLLPVSASAFTFRLEEATIADINQAFDAGALTSEKLVQLYLNRIDAYDVNGPGLNLTFHVKSEKQLRKGF